MLSRDPDELDGAKSDSILDDELGSDRALLSGDEYTSDDDGPGGEPVAEKEDKLSPWADVDGGGGGKESSGEQGSGVDVECPECGKLFKNDKSMFGHLRSHPNRGYKGASPPDKKMKLSPASASPDGTDGSSAQCSGRDPRLTPFEIFCACILPTLRCRDNQAEQPQPPSVTERKLNAVDEKTEAAIGVTGNVGAQVKTEDPGPAMGDALLCDGPIVKIPKKKRRSVSKEERQANKKVKLTPVTKEKRPYPCKHCKAEFTTHQALGGHMAGHHREKKTPVLNKEETSEAHQGVAAQTQKGKQAKAQSEGLSLLSRRLQIEQLSMGPNMGWLSKQQAPEGHRKLHLVRRPPDGAPPAADGGQRQPLNIDLNVQAPEQD